MSWIIDNLEDDPDPSVNNAPHDPTGNFNLHFQTKNGESSRIIQTVRGRLCWLLMRMVAHPRVEEYERIFGIVEKYATGENLYIRLHATVPLVELARRRFANYDANKRFMSDQLAESIKQLTLRMIEDNSVYPAVLEWIAHVVVRTGDLDEDQALRVIEKFLTIEESEAGADVSWIMIYFGLFRENSFKQLGPFNSNRIRDLLKMRLASGSGHFRATAAGHFKGVLGREGIGFDAALPYVQSLVNGPTNRIVNYHLYEIMAMQAATYPQIVGDLMEKTVTAELETLDGGGEGIWHPRQFSETLRTLEKAGQEQGKRVSRIRAAMEPYQLKGLIYGLDS